jgi:arylsulfatase A-like enzyme
MDLYKAIQELYLEKERLERVIASLEELQRTASAAPENPPLPRRRGRKSMTSEEREEVSERMKKYWAARRKQPAPEE